MRRPDEALVILRQGRMVRLHIFGFWGILGAE
jgi:hypothetical protein